MVRTFKKTLVPTDPEKLKQAVDSVKNGELGIREAARLYVVPKSTVARFVQRGDNDVKSSGGQLSLPLNSELELVQCLIVKSRWGFAETVSDIKCHVQEYVKANIDNDNEIGQYLRKYCKFKDCMPGKDWITAFMRRHNLSIKNPSTLQKSRKTAAADPNIILPTAGATDEISSTNLKKRMRTNPSSRIITDDDFLKEIVELEEKIKSRTVKSKTMQTKKKAKPSQQKEKTTPVNKNTINSDTESNNDSSDDINENDTTDSTEVIFNLKTFTKIKPVEQDVYVVYYDNGAYVGRVMKLYNTVVEVYFYERKTNNEYHLRAKRDIDQVDPKYFISGPLKLSGTPPFIINGVDKAFSAYKKAGKE